MCEPLEEKGKAMTGKSQVKAASNDLLEISSSNESLALVPRPKTLSITGAIENERSSLILPTRRNFLVTASLATAGLLIRPVEGFTTIPSNMWFGIADLFKNFGKALFYNLINLVPGNVTGFLNLANSALGQVQGNGFPRWDWQKGCFGNGSQLASEFLFGQVGGQQRLNAAAAFLDKKFPGVIKAILAAASYIGVLDVAPGIFSVSENLSGVKALPLPPARFLPAKSSDRDEMITVYQDTVKKQLYFAPDMDSEISKVARETIKAPRTLARDFATPQLYQSKTGSVVLVQYQIGKETEYKPGERGKGQSSVYVTKPEDETARKKILKNRDFLTNSTQMKAVIDTVKKANSDGNPVEGRTFDFVVGD